MVLGKEDKLASILSVTLEGGKELRAAITINLRVLPRAALNSWFHALQGGEEGLSLSQAGGSNLPDAQSNGD